MRPADRIGVVIDTMVFGSMFVEQPNPTAERYRALIGKSPALLSFQTVMELRFGALRANWGEFRRRRLERRISELTIMQPDDATMTACAKLRVDCQRIGRALADKIHNSDRWIEAAAIRLDVPLMTGDGIFEDAPGLRLLTIHDVNDH